MMIINTTILVFSVHVGLLAMLL